jgi:hypothetical protein
MSAMSIISLFPSDHSDLLCKRYAAAVTTYFDNPAAAKEPVAQVPLENVFRVLEMYRYDAFLDEHRKGVLGMEGDDDLGDLRHEGSWHVNIKVALENAMSEVFGTAEKEVVVSQLQAALRMLVAEPPAKPADSCRQFFVKFSERLAGQPT